MRRLSPFGRVRVSVPGHRGLSEASRSRRFGSSGHARSYLQAWRADPHALGALRAVVAEAFPPGLCVHLSDDALLDHAAVALVARRMVLVEDPPPAAGGGGHRASSPPEPIAAPPREDPEPLPRPAPSSLPPPSPVVPPTAPPEQRVEATAQAAVLRQAADRGVPFCEACERARLAA